MFKCKNPTIAIVDSGIGGVSVLRQLIDKYKFGNYIYFADNLFMPYGNKNQEWLRKRLDVIIKLLKTNYHADHIIIACNTASSAVRLNVNNKDLTTMVFDEKYVYFATELTKINLPFNRVISNKNLAKQIEKNIFNEKKLTKIIKQNVARYDLNKLNEFVLGCTHYELVKPIFEKFCPNSKIINNSSFVINNFRFNSQLNELNIVIMLSKKSRDLENKILKLINR